MICKLHDDLRLGNRLKVELEPLSNRKDRFGGGKLCCLNPNQMLKLLAGDGRSETLAVGDCAANVVAPYTSLLRPRVAEMV